MKNFIIVWIKIINFFIVKKLLKIIPVNYLLWTQQYLKDRYLDRNIDLCRKIYLESIGKEFWMMYLR
jgi:ABC-type uncharacterized transport system permease subunit